MIGGGLVRGKWEAVPEMGPWTGLGYYYYMLNGWLRRMSENGMSSNENSSESGLLSPMIC